MNEVIDSNDAIIIPIGNILYLNRILLFSLSVLGRIKAINILTKLVITPVREEQNIKTNEIMTNENTNTLNPYWTRYHSCRSRLLFRAPRGVA